MRATAIRLEEELTPTTLAEVGQPTGVSLGRGGELLAVASTFGDLYMPGRALHGGHRLKYRLSLYTRGGVRLGVMDHASFPINEVVIHPVRPWVAVATGSYDGGYLFEGELLLWDWETGEVRCALPESREVTRVRFDEQGRLLTALLRPRNAHEFEPDKPFDVFLGLRTPTEQAWAGIPEEALARLRPGPPAAFGFDAGKPGSGTTQDAESQAAMELGRLFPGYEQRSHCWDVAWLDDHRLALTHEACLLEVWATNSVREAHHVGSGFGCQLLFAPKAQRYLVHEMHRENFFQETQDRSSLHELNLETLGLRPFHVWDRAYSFSLNQEGWLLGRDTTPDHEQRERADLVLEPGTPAPRATDLGAYDPFNHFLRLDGFPDLYFLQGTPRDSHEDKRLVRWGVSEGREVPLWPIEWAQVGKRQLMDCAALRIDEATLAFAFRVYSPRVDLPYAGVLTQRRLDDGTVLWQYPINAQVTALAHSEAHGCLIYALTSGELGLLDVATGALLWSGRLRVGGVESVALSLALRDERLAVGTLDGRLLLSRLDSQRA